MTFTIPIVEALLANPSTTAMVIYPTKALAQDQLAFFRDLLAPEISDGLLRVDTMDGDVSCELDTFLHFFPLSILPVAHVHCRALCFVNVHQLSESPSLRYARFADVAGSLSISHRSSRTWSPRSHKPRHAPLHHPTCAQRGLV